MIHGKLINKFERKLEKINKNIQEGKNVEIMLQKKQHTEKQISDLRHYIRTVTLYERANWKWFNGTEADVLTYDDLVDYCNECVYDETPLQLLTERVFIAIGGSALAQHDLREYLYLPSSLIEEDENIANFKKAFKGFGEQDFVQF